jgi:FkbM family methyltransferase
MKLRAPWHRVRYPVKMVPSLVELAVSKQSPVAGPLERLKVLVLGIGAPINEVLPPSLKPIVRVRIRVLDDVATVCVRDWTELYVMWTVYIEREYGVELDPAPQTILDIGGNVGVASLWLRDQYPQARLEVLEPAPNTLAMANAGAGQFPGVSFRALCLAQETGHVEFTSGPDVKSWSAMIVSEAEVGEVETVSVPAVSFDDLFETLGMDTIDLIKTDAEAAEWFMLASLTAETPVNHIVGEFHEGGDAIKSLGRSEEDVITSLRAEHGWQVLEFDPDRPGEYRDAEGPWKQRLLYLRNARRIGAVKTPDS